MVTRTYVIPACTIYIVFPTSLTSQHLKLPNSITAINMTGLLKLSYYNLITATI